MQRETLLRSLTVATCLCIVCSVMVSSAAVLLRPIQEENKRRQMQTDILRVAGLYEPGVPIADLFRPVETHLVDLASGDYVDNSVADPKQYDPKAAAKDPDQSAALPDADDLAGLKRREKIAPVYLIRTAAGQLDQVVLPIRGKGLWSTIYGFLSLESDLRTVRGITFYEHGETPGLGGEIENPTWKAKWQGKVIRDENGGPRIEPVRGEVLSSDPDASHKIDALAGATITTRGVTKMIRFWLGPEGFGPYLEKLRSSTPQI